MTRTGKIARLPRAVREELNQRLADGEPGVRLVDWLNSLPAVQQALINYFDGREINEPNLSEWKQGGYLDWEARQEMLGCTQELVAEAKAIKAATEGSLAEHLSTVLGARYAQLLAGWNGEVDETFQQKLKGLRLLGQEIATLRQGDVRAERLKLEQDRLAEWKKSESVRSLEYCVKESKAWPEVSATFTKAFGLLLDYKAGKKRNWEYEQQERAKAGAERARQEKEEAVARERARRRAVAEQKRRMTNDQ